MTRRPATWGRRFTEKFSTEMRTWKKKKGCTMPVPPQTCDGHAVGEKCRVGQRFLSEKKNKMLNAT